MLKYKVVSSRSLDELENEVNNLLYEDWELAGTCQMSYSYNMNLLYCQTLIKYLSIEETKKLKENYIQGK